MVSSRHILLRPARLTWQVFSRVSTILLLPISALWWSALLIRHVAAIREADIVILMTKRMGFSHSVMGPDMARRMYPGKRCLFIVPSWPVPLNPKVPLLWTDVRVLFLPRLVIKISWAGRALVFLPFLKIHDQMIQWITRRLASLLGGSQIRYLSLMEAYGEVERLKEGFEPTPGGAALWAGGFSFEVAYNLLLLRTTVSKARLPSHFREDVERQRQRAWRQAGFDGMAKLCCLYLRYEKPDSTSGLRNSSEFESYVPAIRLLIAKGYQVLLIGDRGMTGEIRRELAGGLIDDSSLDIEPHVYRLFAATEAEIFIAGGHGGGITLPRLNGIPSLYVNWFPVFSGYRDCWYYFKPILDKNGDPVSGQQLFARHAYDICGELGKPAYNTTEEITEATACFLEDVDKPGQPDPHAHIAALIPHDTTFRICGARISPAWIKRYFSEPVELDQPLKVEG